MITGFSIFISLFIWLILIGMVAYGEHNFRPKWHENVGFLLMTFSSLGMIFFLVQFILLKLF